MNVLIVSAVLIGIAYLIYRRIKWTSRPRFHTIAPATVVDQTMMDHLTSEAPLPSQSALDSLLQPITRVCVIDGGVSRGKAIGKDVLLDTDDLTGFRECFAISEDPKSFGHCMCLGDPAIELYAGSKRAATLGFHHGFAIRWDNWKYDGMLQNGQLLVDWLAERGVTGPREEVQRAREQAERAKVQVNRWHEAMPTCLEPFWHEIIQSSGMMAFVPNKPSATAQPPKPHPYAHLLQALETDIPDIESRILALLAWFGQGAGPWSGYPSYEGVTEALLLTFETADILRTLESHDLTSAHLEGVARYFGGWQFSQRKPDDLRALPKDLKTRLFNHVMESHPDDDKMSRAKHAFKN